MANDPLDFSNEMQMQAGLAMGIQPDPPQTQGSVSQSLTSIEGYTGRYIVMAKRGVEKKGMAALQRESGIKLQSVHGTAEPDIGAKTIPENRGLLFPELGIAVVNPTSDSLGALSAAVAQSDALELMEPERFVYATTEVDLAWLRGFKDATNEIYKRLANPGSDQHTPGVQSTFDESQHTWSAGDPGSQGERDRARYQNRDSRYRNRSRPSRLPVSLDYRRQLHRR